MNIEQRAGGFIYGNSSHYLDHLAPLCVLLDIPLIVTEESIAKLANHYYPGIKVIHWEALVFTEKVVSNFEIIFCCTPRVLFDDVFFFAQKMLGKKIHTIWCPHGNSDKGATIFYMEALKKEKAALVYGKQMIEFFQKKGIWDSLQGHVITGNYRLAFFNKEKDFYESLLRTEILRKLPAAKKMLLYAPTWNDNEQSGSFFDAIETLIETLPPEHNLIVKLHPNLLLQEELRVEEIIEKYEHHPHVLFLSRFPPVYPLLSLVDIYIGDMSSIGYDFLSFDKPLFLLNQNKRSLEDRGLYLFRCGIEISKENYARIHTIISHFFQFELRDYSSIRKEVYLSTFGHLKSNQDLQHEIEALYTVFDDEDLNFF